MVKTAMIKRIKADENQNDFIKDLYEGCLEDWQRAIELDDKFSTSMLSAIYSVNLSDLKNYDNDFKEKYKQLFQAINDVSALTTGINDYLKDKSKQSYIKDES